MPRPSRRSLIGLAIGAAGVAGAGIGGRVLARRALPEPGRRSPSPLGPGIRERRLEMDDGVTLRVLEAGPPADSHDPAPPVDSHDAGPPADSHEAGPPANGRDDPAPPADSHDAGPPADSPSKPPFVLLHGITLGADIWHRQLEDLGAAGHRVVAYDLRGHGGSDAGHLTLERLVEDLAQVLEQLDLRRVVLVGHSMGGMVAVKGLAADPVLAAGRGRVAALALVATSANPVGGSGLPGAGAAVRALQPALSRSAWLTSRIPGPTLPKADLAYLLARVNFGDDPIPEEVVRTQQLVTGVRAHVTGELLVEILRFDDLAALEGVELPAAVVVGTRDLVTPVRHGRALAAAIGGAELTVLEGCGHMVMLERPDELDAVLAGLAARA